MFPKLSDYLLAFLMNLTGNILSIYNTFQGIMTDSANCDYTSMSTKLGSLFKRLYSVTPIETEAALKPIDIEKSKIYIAANSVYLGFRAFVMEQAEISKQTLTREKERKQSTMLPMDQLYIKYYRPAQKH